MTLCDYNEVDGTVAAIRSAAGEIAAVIVESMLGSGGCIPAEPAFLTAIAEATRAAGAILIFDEVMTSRMSEGGLQERLGILPDGDHTWKICRRRHKLRRPRRAARHHGHLRLQGASRRDLQ